MEQQEIETPAEAAPCDQFICFFDTGTTGDEKKDRYPVGVGETREDAFAMGISNVMPDLAGLGVYGMAQSGFITIPQPQLTAEEFETVGGVVRDFFAGRIRLETTTRVIRVDDAKPGNASEEI